MAISFRQAAIFASLLLILLATFVEINCRVDADPNGNNNNNNEAGDDGNGDQEQQTHHKHREREMNRAKIQRRHIKTTAAPVTTEQQQQEEGDEEEGNADDADQKQDEENENPDHQVTLIKTVNQKNIKMAEVLTSKKEGVETDQAVPDEEQDAEIAENDPEEQKGAVETDQVVPDEENDATNAKNEPEELPVTKRTTESPSFFVRKHSKAVLEIVKARKEANKTTTTTTTTTAAPAVANPVNPVVDKAAKPNKEKPTTKTAVLQQPLMPFQRRQQQQQQQLEQQKQQQLLQQAADDTVSGGRLKMLNVKLNMGEINLAEQRNSVDWLSKYGSPQNYAIRYSPPPSNDGTWPMPQVFVGNDELYKIDPSILAFVVENGDNYLQNCEALREIIERYKSGLLFQSARPLAFEDAILHPGAPYLPSIENPRNGSLKDSMKELGFFDRKVLARMKQGNRDRPPKWYKLDSTLLSVHINISSECSEYPRLNADESYELKIAENGISIRTSDIWGVLYALETLSQMIFVGENRQYLVRSAVIEDWPRFRHRGILIDSSRHFLPISVIKQNIDAMVQNKFNVLHWHLSDDQSFPLYLYSFPEFANAAAFSPEEIYTPDDVHEVVEYARFRGVRVMPELDTPSHVLSWRHLPYDILTRCYDHNGNPTGDLGPLDPTNTRTYKVLKKVLRDVAEMFPDAAFHGGGDEVPLNCWASNPNISEYRRHMFRKKSHSSLDASNGNNTAGPDKIEMHEVVASYNKRLLKLFKASRENYSSEVDNPNLVMWEEAHENDPTISKSVVMHVWKSQQSAVKNLVDDGYHVLFSQCWYVNYINYGIDWAKFYRCDPAKMGSNVIVTDETKILGGEVCIWGEYIDETNLMSTLWPRASAAAERLWSSREVVDVGKAGRRLEEHRCRMVRRGIAASPVSGPGTCGSSAFVSASALWDREMLLSDLTFRPEAKHYQRHQRQHLSHDTSGRWQFSDSFKTNQQHMRTGFLSFGIGFAGGNFSQICIDVPSLYFGCVIMLLLFSICLVARRSGLKPLRPLVSKMIALKGLRSPSPLDTSAGFILTPSPKQPRHSSYSSLFLNEKLSKHQSID